MAITDIKCITNGCKNKIPLSNYWNMCLDCYLNIPNHIPIDQINLYNELKLEKENGDKKN